MSERWKFLVLAMALFAVAFGSPAQAQEQAEAPEAEQAAEAATEPGPVVPSAVRAAEAPAVRDRGAEVRTWK